MSTNSIALSRPKIYISTEMRIWERKFLLFFIDCILMMMTLFYSHQINNPDFEFIYFLKHNYFSLLYFFCLFWVLAFTFNLYDLEFVNKTRRVLPVSFLIGITCTFLYMLTGILNPGLAILEVPGFIFILGFTVLLIVWRTFYARVIHVNLFVKTFIILTTENFNSKLIKKIKYSIEGQNCDHDIKISRIYEIPTKEKELKSFSRTLEKITNKKLINGIILLNHEQEIISSSLNSVLVKIISKGVQVSTHFELFEEVKEALPLEFGKDHFYNVLPISKSNQNYFYLLWHMTINMIASFFGIVLMLILTPLILILNMFFNKGPLFYRQLRIGKGGEEILITKFRSMIVGAEKHGAKMSVQGDDRITSFGKILRNLRIDELPQFWSVIKGDMNFIGPRPERKIFIKQLIKEIPLYDSRHLIKPGITGWAQVKYGYGTNVNDSYKKLEYDLYYIKNRSITLDIRIIFKTIQTIAFYKGL